MTEEIKPGYTRVSEILHQWRAYDMVDKNLLEERARIGTKVHMMIDADINNVPFICDDATDEEKRYFDSYLAWKDSVKPKFIASEQRFYHESTKITGCVDAIVQIPWEERVVVIDWKTSSQPVKGIWDLQSAFYTFLAMENGVESLGDRSLFVQLSRDGSKPKIHEYFFDQNMLVTCMSAVNIYKFLISKGFSFDRNQHI